MTPKTSSQIIVIADDEPFILQAYEEGLKRAGFIILAAHDGAAALKFTQEHKPNLVLLDLIMPHLTGFEVLEKIKSDDKLKHIPVIVVSNLSKATDETQVRSLGAAEFIVKSDHSLKEVISIVRATLERAHQKK